MATLNPDGVSVKGCSIIYAPAGQAGEYSPLACNPYRGCGHKCAYCYVPGVLRMDRATFDSGAVERPGFLTALKKDAAKYQTLGVTAQCMLSFTTDPYHPGDNSLTRQVLETLKEHGLGICTLTKGGVRALRDLDLFRPGRDAFASTLTSLDDGFSLKWERDAALPKNRLHALREFHNAGIFTWVSLEPVLDTAATLEIIRQTHEFVDLYKVGRVNYVGLTKTTDWKQFTADVLRVMEETGAKHYIKKDLQPYLPEGYANPMRVDQFRADPFPILPGENSGGAGVSGWNPIETAPKDGTLILAYFTASIIGPKFDVLRWCGWGGGIWQTSSGFNCLSASPTHWMPLPDPPKEARA